MAEDFFLRFGAIVSTVRINQAAVKSASNALKAALSTNAEINVDVGFKQRPAFFCYMVWSEELVLFA